MKAALVEKFGPIENIQIKDVEKPALADNEVLVSVEYAGVNFPDVLISKGLYQFKPEFPFSPGGEVSGTVVEVGRDVKSINVGEKVMAAAGWGGFSEFAKYEESNVFVLPTEIDVLDASILLETYATAYHALVDRANIKSNERLLVLGAAGGTGLAAIQLAKTMGVEVIASASTSKKLELCKKNGADYAINYIEENLKDELKKLGGIDVIFDPVGGPLSEMAFRSLVPMGRHLVIGFASGDIPSIPWNLPLLKSASIIGVFWGGFWRNFPQMNNKNVEVLLKMLAENKINPVVSNVYTLDEVVIALRDIESRTLAGKNVIKING